MGVLIYGPRDVEFDDRLLTHLEFVIVNKLRRGESFMMSWLVATANATSRESMWLNVSSPIYFKYVGSRVPSLNREWIAVLEAEANGPRGLIVRNEDGTPAVSHNR
ncbi:hypothetical protein [Humibacter albus]|uniref:DUF7882 family protein n=1 Tax=Humibacter albus TaxID=427754 RepID=UPI000411EE23|nr:hypothetical protein [Humibacter albus]